MIPASMYNVHLHIGLHIGLHMYVDLWYCQESNFSTWVQLNAVYRNIISLVEEEEEEEASLDYSIVGIQKIF